MEIRLFDSLNVIHCRQPELNSAPSSGFQSQETRTPGQPDARWVTKWDKCLSLKWINWPFCLKKCSIFAYFHRELETSFIAEDGQRSSIFWRTYLNLSVEERNAHMLRQFKADIAAQPNLKCSMCHKQFKRNLYDDSHWCRVARRGYCRFRKIQLS